MLERVLLVADVAGDDRHVLGHRDHRHVDRAGDPLGGAVAGAGLGRGHVRVRHEVDVGPGDAAGVGGQDDGAVHLRQLGQPLRAAHGVEQEATRADVEHLGPVADHDQRAHARLQDAVEALAEGLARRDRGERVARQLRRRPRVECSRHPGGAPAGRAAGPPPGRHAGQHDGLGDVAARTTSMPSGASGEGGTSAG